MTADQSHPVQSVLRLQDEVWHLMREELSFCTALGDSPAAVSMWLCCAVAVGL
jgi:hypothetical protein